MNKVVQPMLAADPENRPSASEAFKALQENAVYKQLEGSTGVPNKRKH